MTRKRYIKLMMAAGLSRNEAEYIVSLGKNEQGQVLSDRMKKHKLATVDAGLVIHMMNC